MSSEPQNRPRAIHINQLLNPEPVLTHHSHHPSSYIQERPPTLTPSPPRLSPPRVLAMTAPGTSHHPCVNHDHSSHDYLPPIMSKERAVVCAPAVDPISYPHSPELNYSSWQTSERASSRIAASASVIKPESLNLEPRDEQASSKRKASDVEDAEEPPKSKRKLTTSKRVGFPSKKRGEVALSNGYAPNVLYKLHDTGDFPYTATPTEMPDKSNVALELQTSRCMSSKYKNEQSLPRCVACTRRWAGDTCRFQALRSLYRNSNGDIMGFSFQEQPTPAMSMKFPNVWNTSLEMSHIQEIKRVIAAALLPTLREELQHVSRSEVICRPRELEVRATCDTCLTSIFSCSWMCRNCGREACAVCFEQVERLTVEPENASPDDLQALKTRRDNHANGNPFFLSCMKRTDHGAKNFSPVTRFSKVELQGIIHTMEELLCHELPSPVPAISHSEAPSAVSPVSNDSEATLTSNSDEIPSHEIARFKDNDLTEEIFRPVWAKGDPILVTDVGSKLKVAWTPEYFIKNYGQDTCVIVECQSDEKSRRVTVGDFFRDFGSYHGRELCWKLKDWPPTSDFKKTFPQLYHDFSQAVPMPNYVRRDGVLNIASHFPSNTVGPDLGPKMYNANANLEQVNNKGSTRLHMDMSDALNILTYAAPRPDGSEGCAAWDIFRAEDSDKLRLFMRAKYSLSTLDPIHSQQVYLEDDARRELWLLHGVKSYRIYQTAGQAVFIPAGCAHQVRNLSDCIKVAVDFVSPENIHRCERLTLEFRDLNQKKAWKEDVLQLRSMMFFCWVSCCQQEEKLKLKSSVS